MKWPRCLVKLRFGGYISSIYIDSGAILSELTIYIDSGAILSELTLNDMMIDKANMMQALVSLSR